MTANSLPSIRRLAEIHALRHDAESPDAGTRHRATLELIAGGHFLAYSDARHAARLALSGAHAREELPDAA